MVRERLAGAGYAVGWSAVRRMPEPAAYALFRRVADAATARGGAGVGRLRANLARVRPDASADELDALVRDGMRSYLRYYADAFRLPSWDRSRVVDRIRVDGEDRLAAALAAGRGAVLALPHMGNWDHAGAWACLTHAPLTTVAERLRPESLYRRFVAYRQTLGMEVLGLGEEGVAATLADRLRAGGLVCLLADRDLGRSGVPVTFFGEPTRMPAGPAALATSTGAALLPVTLWYDGPDLGARVHPALGPDGGAEAAGGAALGPDGGASRAAVAALTQRLADVFAAGIAEHPADWHMLQRLWLADLDPARLAAADAAGAGPAGPA